MILNATEEHENYHILTMHIECRWKCWKIGARMEKAEHDSEK
jgi:hypothetical protein